VREFSSEHCGERSQGMRVSSSLGSRVVRRLQSSPGKSTTRARRGRLYELPQLHRQRQRKHRHDDRSESVCRQRQK